MSTVKTLKGMNEGRFTSRVNKPSMEDTEWPLLAKKYIPRLKSFLDDLEDLDIARRSMRKLGKVNLNIDGSTFMFLDFPGWGGVEHVFSMTVESDYLTKYLGIDLKTRELGIYYFSSGSWKLWQPHRFSLDDIDEIIANDSFRECSDNGEMLKKMVRGLPKYLRKVDKLLDSEIGNATEDIEMKKINENQKVTLTVGQLKRLVKESGNDYHFNDMMLMLSSISEVSAKAQAIIKGSYPDVSDADVEELKDNAESLRKMSNYLNELLGN